MLWSAVDTFNPFNRLSLLLGLGVWRWWRWKASLKRVTRRSSSWRERWRRATNILATWRTNYRHTVLRSTQPPTLSRGLRQRLQLMVLLISQRRHWAANPAKTRKPLSHWATSVPLLLRSTQPPTPSSADHHSAALFTSQAVQRAPLAATLAGRNYDLLQTAVADLLPGSTQPPTLSRKLL